MDFPESCGYIQKKKLFDCEPNITYVSGDGSVPLTSAEAGNHWEDTVLVEGHTIDGVKHQDLIKN